VNNAFIGHQPPNNAVNATVLASPRTFGPWRGTQTMTWSRIAALVAIVASAQALGADAPLSSKQKSDFLALLPTLPHEGEFLTKKGVDGGAPYVNVLTVVRKD
jgi:hypothetical protein